MCGVVFYLLFLAADLHTLNLCGIFYSELKSVELQTWNVTS